MSITATELKQNLGRYLLMAATEDVFITKNGYGDLVIMSMEAYEDLINTASIDAAIGKAESEYAKTHESHDARAALASLRRKHFG